jgi:hypothetical protein
LSNPVPALRDTVTSARNRSPQDRDKDDIDLTRYCLSLISESDKSEDSRRRQDRIGGNMLFGRHWNVQLPPTRVSMTVNYAKALVEHRVALTTKQQPIPVVESLDGSDTPSVRIMRGVLMDWWDRDGMQAKLKRGRRISDTTRTCAFKALWDPTLYDGAGDACADLIPGWRLIIDPTTDDRRRMRFIGDRTVMTRSRAMMLYKDAGLEASRAIEDASQVKSWSTGGSSVSPIKDPWDRFASVYPGVTVVAGVPTLEGYSAQGFPRAQEIEQMVEVVELYLLDPTMVEDEVPKYDEEGFPVRVPVLGDGGIPIFDELPGERVELPDGSLAVLPAYKLRTVQATERKFVRKYPFYRRVTMLLPDQTVIEDRAWDFPNPYSLLQGGSQLEGPWSRGVMLDLESLQNQLNVSCCMMMENLRFSAMRVAISYNAGLERNTLSVNPGDVVNATGEKGSLEFVPFPELSQAWFGWLETTMKLMEKIAATDGVMSGEQVGRVDSAEAYDFLAEITGSRLTSDAQDMERCIAELMETIGALVQKGYTTAHAVKVEDLEGNISIQNVTQSNLVGTFRYKVRVGSTLAWSSSAIRKRALEDMEHGVLDKIGYWQAVGQANYQGIKARLEAEPPQLQGGAGSPPKRTRQTIPANGRPKPPVPTA